MIVSVKLANTTASLSLMMTNLSKQCGCWLAKFQATPPPPLIDVLVNIFPSNPVKARADGEMLQIIVFALLVGYAIAGLFYALAEVNRAAINARGRAGFESALCQLEFFESGRQAHGRRVTRAATRVVVQADVNLAV